MKKTVQLLKALSDPTRLRLLNLLQPGELCVCDLMAVLDMPQSTISRHLATLRHADLVSDERRGQWMYYKITDSKQLSGKLLKLLQSELTGEATAQKDLQTLARLRADRGCGCNEATGPENS